MFCEGFWFLQEVLVTREPTFLSRSLNVSLPRAILAFSVAWWKQSLCKQHLFLDYFATFVMTKIQDCHTTFAMTIHNTHDRPGVSAPICAVALYQRQHRLWFHTVIKLTKTKRWLKRHLSQNYKSQATLKNPIEEQASGQLNKTNRNGLKRHHDLQKDYRNL